TRRIDRHSRVAAGCECKNICATRVDTSIRITCESISRESRIAVKSLQLASISDCQRGCLICHELQVERIESTYSCVHAIRISSSVEEIDCIELTCACECYVTSRSNRDCATSRVTNPELTKSKIRS